MGLRTDDTGSFGSFAIAPNRLGLALLGEGISTFSSTQPRAFVLPCVHLFYLAYTSFQASPVNHIITMTATTVKDVVDNLERYHDMFDGNKKSVESVMDKIDALVSPDVTVSDSGREFDYNGLLKDLDTKLQNGWFLESAEVKQVDQTTIEYLTRIMTHQGTMTTPRYRATIGDDFKITRIVSHNVAEENTAAPMKANVEAVGEEDDDTVLQQIKAELDQAMNEPDDDDDDEVSAMS